MSKFEIDPATLAEAVSDPKVQAYMRERVQRGYEFTQSPEGSPVETGEYRAAWKVVPVIKDGIPGWRLINDDYKAEWIEYGTARDMPAYRVAGRAYDVIKGDDAK